MRALEIQPGMRININHGGSHTVTATARIAAGPSVYADLTAEGWLPVGLTSGGDWVATEIVWDESVHVIHGDALVAAA